MDLGWNGGQGGRVWQKKTNSFFLSCCFITHALGHPVPIPLSLGSSPLHTQQKGMSAMMGLPFSRGEAGILTGVWGWGKRRDNGSCWQGGLPGRGLLGLGGLSGAATVERRVRGPRFTPLPLLTSVSLLWFQSPTPLGERPGAPLPQCLGRSVQPLLSYWAFFQLPSTLLPLWTGFLKPLITKLSSSLKQLYLAEGTGDSVGRNLSITRKGTRP